MTDIRELLREATDDLVLDRGDPVSRVRRATARRRRAWAATIGVVAAVAAAIVVPLSLTTWRSTDASSPRPTHTSTPRAVAQTWAVDDGGVAAGLGAIWGVQCCGGSRKPSWVDKLDPITGKRLARIVVPGPTVSIAVGAGRVWTLGATDGGPSAISVVDPVTSGVTTLHLANPQAEPSDIAFAAGSAWVTMDLLDQVWRLTPTRTGVRKSVLAVPGNPADIATTGNGAMWVQRASAGRDSLTRIVATRDSAHLGTTVPWLGAIYSAAGRSTLWASSADLRDIIALTPARLGGCSACAQADNMVVKGRQVYTALSTSRGLFVSTFPQQATPGHTYFYSNLDLENSRQTPTARISLGGPLAPDGDGVVIATEVLTHWVPAP